MFAKTMIKYVFGILFCAFLLLGLQQKTDAGLQKLRSASATVTQNTQLQFRALSNSHVSKSRTTAKRASNKKDIFGTEMFTSEIGDCMLEDFVHFRCRTVPTRLLKDTIIAARRLFHLSDTQRIENKYQGFSPHTGYIKFSNRYYVYTLEHILI